jgi:hypothetical protein
MAAARRGTCLTRLRRERPGRHVAATVLSLLLMAGCADNPAAPSEPAPVPAPSNPLPSDPDPEPKPAPEPGPAPVPDPPKSPEPPKPEPPRPTGVYGRPMQFGWYFQTFTPGQHPQTNTQACPGSIHVVADEADGTHPFNPWLPIIATAQVPFGGKPSYLKADPGLIRYVLLEAGGGGNLLGDHANALQWARANGKDVMVYYDGPGAPPGHLVGLADIFALQAYPDRSESPEQSADRIAGHLRQFGGRVATVRALYTRNGTLPVSHVLRFNELLTQVIRETPAQVVMDLAFSCARTSGALDNPALLDYGRFLADAAGRGL